MGVEQYQTQIGRLLSKADIKLNGDRRWDIQVHKPALYGRILGQGSLGFGEAYMRGWWDCEQLDQMFKQLLSANLASQVTTLRDRLFYLQAHLINRQKGQRSVKVATTHYDVGNNLYQRMLDSRMMYSCGYWQDANSLEQAQQHKLELICRKLKLEPGMKVLDIGCGWGGAARYMAQHYAVEVVGITISKEQAEFATKQASGLNVEIRLQDYQDVNEQFDRIYSIGMFEHVGFKNYSTFFKMADRCLIDGGLFLLHTIGYYKTLNKVDPWIERYIFPNSILPSSELICQHSCQHFTLEDWHNFGLDYHTTLLAWNDNIQAAWPDLPEYDERFQRMWHYYLMCCAGAFKACRNQLWQIVFSKGVQDKAYTAVRSAIQ